VIGVIFESRPNVTADAGALCLMAGNAAILRAGSDSFRTSSALAGRHGAGIAAAGLPVDAIQLVPVRDREAGRHDADRLPARSTSIVPRGGRSLVERVQADARVPVFAHLEGVNHVYVRPPPISTWRSPSSSTQASTHRVCGPAETLLVDRAAAVTISGRW
jgi:glutamate-5-semialdehyde dehydrogenase